MGTREVYQEKLHRGNLHHDPTLEPGLGCPRCPRCLSLLHKEQDKSEWEIAPVMHDFTTVVGSGIGGILVCLVQFMVLTQVEEQSPHSFKCFLWLMCLISLTLTMVLLGIPYLQNRIKGPKWLPFVIGLPTLVMHSAASAAFGGYALPKLSQLTMTSYYGSSSASHYGISLLTRYIEDNHISKARQKQVP